MSTLRLLCYAAVAVLAFSLRSTAQCVDTSTHCEGWKAIGECTGANKAHMEKECRASCGLCGSGSTAVETVTTTATTTATTGGTGLRATLALCPCATRHVDLRDIVLETKSGDTERKLGVGCSLRLQHHQSWLAWPPPCPRRPC